MTPIDRFERQLPDQIDELAAPRTPAYLDDLLTRTAATRQRPAWTFLERWLPMTLPLTIPRRRPVPATPTRLFAVLLALVLLTAAAVAAGAWLTRIDVRPAVLFGERPDGFVVVGWNDHIWTVDPVSGDQAPLAPDGGWPTWSPTGDAILFWRATDGGDLLMVLDSSMEPRQLTPAPLVNAGSAGWSPDGTAVAVSSEVDGHQQVTVLAADGSGELLGPGMPMTFIDFPAWVPAGGPDRALDIVARTTSASSDGSVRLDRFTAAAAAGPITDSPILDLDAIDESVGARAIAFGSTYDLLKPTPWSDAGGLSIAFTQLHSLGLDAPDGNGFRVHVFDGTTDRALEWQAGADDEAWPAWDSSGSRVAFQSFDATEGSHLVVATLDPACPDGCPRYVASDLIVTAGPNELTYDWSPDGTRLLILSEAYGTAWMMDASTGALTPQSWTATSGPSWRP